MFVAQISQHDTGNNLCFFLFLFQKNLFIVRRHLVMIQGFDGTCAALFEHVGSPADSRVNNICVLKD